MKLGIIGAMEQEVETLLGLLENTVPYEKAGSTYYEGTLDGLGVVVVQCGIGKVNAALCVQVLCDVFAVTHVVNTGIAGSLKPELDIGDLVISRDAMYHDVDCVHFGYTMGQMPGMPVSYEADPLLVKLAFQAAESVNPGHTVLGRIASGDQFVASSEVKNKIWNHFEAYCAEMEGAAIAHVCHLNNMPFVVIRSISDKADEQADMSFEEFTKIAVKNSSVILENMLNNI